MLDKIVKLGGDDLLVRGRICKTANGKSYCSFTKIPYAQCPTGPSRFLFSETVQWEGCLNCTTKLEDLANQDIRESELLFLNVFALNNRNSLLPRSVMVFVPSCLPYLGPYNKNTGLYGPDYLLEEDIIVVVVSFRSGVLGFLKTEQTPEVDGTMGMRDLLQALEWVKLNIKDFGGDSNNITVVGQGAGASAVHKLILTFSTKDLIKRIILQSGLANTLCFGKYSVSAYAEALGFMDFEDEKSAIKFLRALRYEKLMYYENQPPSREHSFMINDDFGMDPVEVPMIVGYNSNDSKIFHTPTMEYMGDNMGYFRGFSHVIGAKEFQKKNNMDVYMYEFQFDGELNFVKKKFGIKQEGACHGDELGYLFKIPGTNVPEPDTPEYTMSKVMVKLWTNYVKYGNPTHLRKDSDIKWEPNKFVVDINKRFISKTI